MITVTGRIATVIETKQASSSGSVYFSFRLADNYGKGEDRETTWYSVLAFISELDADLLSRGSLVKVTGNLEAKAYLDKEGKPQAVLTILASKVDPVKI